MMKKILHPLALLSYLSLIILLLMLLFPSQALTASLRGLEIWWEVLFPALFPFFVISELMLGFGVVHFFGKILDPLMRPIFRIPGIGGFVVTLGYISGYPVGARLTAQLYEQQLLNRREGERLVAFTTSSDPIFLIGAVSIGFFGQAELAVVLAAAHYIGALIIGLLMRFHDARDDRHVPDAKLHIKSFSYRRTLLHQALRAMHEARLLDGRPFSVILQQAINSAIRMMIVVGGLVVFFSVVLQLLSDGQVLYMLIIALQELFQILGISTSVAEAIIPGIFEVTLGAQQASMASLPLQHQAAIAVAILSWGGLSVHAQVASLLSQTSIRYMPFFISRFAHSIISVLLLYALWDWLGPK
ncbi:MULTISPECIES: sporulation integral membrane protein YlbJ [Paenibacillus]|uniref:sporulation integral membrane protein YlbJ n=1 Tax=Paenibacillus TaxID=44249 RepID=UPI0020423A3C|nr:sporulation integral membrane protein YlbJ [Paenibacillus camelliae]MCM3632636.1 sporulation integral membrane protein YlbJ [Paenibacillus camelliae]